MRRTLCASSNIIGAKAFLDGVTEAHTGWQNQDYLDQPGYHGAERMGSTSKIYNNYFKIYKI